MTDTDKQRDADLALIEEMEAACRQGTSRGYWYNIPRLLALAREALTAREDAARLDWLFEQNDWTTPAYDPSAKVWFMCGHRADDDDVEGDSPRSAIDAARAPRNPKGGE